MANAVVEPRLCKGKVLVKRFGFGTKGKVANAVVEPRLCKGKVLVKGLALGLRAKLETTSSSQDSARENYQSKVWLWD